MMKLILKPKVEWVTVTLFLIVSCLSAAAKEPIRIYHDGNLDVPPGALDVEALQAHPEIQRQCGGWGSKSRQMPMK